MAGILQSYTTLVYNSNAVCSSCKLDRDCWVLDSGASDHMSFDSKALHDLCLLAKPILVSLPNGYKVQVMITLSCIMCSWFLFLSIISYQLRD